MPHARLSLLSLVPFLGGFAIGYAGEPNVGSETPTFRRPHAIVRVGDELLVGNRTGTLSVLDPASREFVAEIQVAERLSALVAGPGDDEVLVCDEARHELVRVRRVGGRWQPVDRIAVAKFPISVSVVGERAVVASSWSRRLSVVDLADRSNEIELLDLPFIPGRQLALPDGTVVVAAAGDGRLAVVDLDPPRIRLVIDLPGHNVGGLAVDPATRRLLVTQQLLRGDTGTTYENVFWGGVLKNVLQEIPLDELESGTEPNPSEPPELAFLGFPSNAAGDPGDVVVTPRGATVVSIGGVNQVHTRRGPTAPFESFDSGRRPAGIALAADGTTAFVCNTYDDTLTVLDLAKLEDAGTIPVALGPDPNPSLVDRGEVLFHDANLSLDGWFSCHSCHAHGHTSGQLTDNLGDGYFGDPKLAPSLLGTAATAPWAWNGSSPTLEAQVEMSILKTMRAGSADPADVAALVAYIRTLEPPPSLAEARGDLDTSAADRGARVFAKRGCTDCHAGEQATSPDLYDVGLRDREGNTEWNPPSLRGVSQRDAFLHDGRAPSLRAVFEQHRHPNGTELPPAELDDLLEYLRGDGPPQSRNPSS